MADPQIRVLIVDDSALVRQVLTRMLNAAPDITVMGAASDPLFAMRRMEQEMPDVIVLDVEMPRMDGLTFLRQLMGTRPVPVVICSSLVEHGSRAAMEALSLGAVSIITKPKLGLRQFLEDHSNDVVASVRAAARASPRRIRNALDLRSQAAGALGVGVGAGMVRTTDRVVAIGTSTGGTQALEVVLTAMPTNAPGIVIVQHMPEQFTAMFADRLNQLCAIEVREAADGDRIVPGLALIAPGGRHMLVKRSGAQYHAEIVSGPLVNRHRPSVNVLFRSCARHCGPNAIGVLMTGMGDDGARGLKEMHDAGAWTMAEDESTCIVFGMPREAIRLQAVDSVLPLDKLSGAILARCRE